MSAIQCTGFEALLDRVGPEALGDDTLAHAARCPACARALSAARLLDALLADEHAVLAPHGFTTAVLARVRFEDAAASLAALPPLDWRTAMPAWSRIATEPVVLLAMLLAGVLVWQSEHLPALALALLAMVHQGWSSLLAGGAGAGVAAPESGSWGARWLADPIVRLGLLTAALTLAPFAAIPLYHLTERLTRSRGLGRA